MNLDPCRYCTFVGDNCSTTSTHVHTHHPGKDCKNHFCWTCGLMFRSENTLKRHNTTVKHLLEEKKMKIVTEDLPNTLWSTTKPEVRYPTFIDHIDQESCAPLPTCKFSNSLPKTLKETIVTIPLTKKGETQDPRLGHGMYKHMKILTTAEKPAIYAEEDSIDNPPFIIENDDKTLSYVPDKVAEDLVNNLINFLDTCEDQNIPVERKIAPQDINLNTPPAIPLTEATNNYVDLTIDSWLTIDSIGITPDVENICPQEIEDFLTNL